MIRHFFINYLSYIKIIKFNILYLLYMKVIIIGGGISGLTCAYELSKYNIDIELHEKDNKFGGLVQGIVKNGKYDEHSWRGFNKNYSFINSRCKDR